MRQIFNEMEKKILSYLPAVLVKSSDRWYIKFYQTDPTTGVRRLFKQSFDLNRVSDLKLRIGIARKLVDELNEKMLPAGFPFVKTTVEQVQNAKFYTPIAEAFALAVKILSASKYNSARTYKSQASLFCDYLTLKNKEKMTIGAFDLSEAQAYLDYVLMEKGDSTATHNNKRRHLHTIFEQLKKRGYVSENPMKNTAKAKVGKKKRQAFSEEDVKTVCTELWKMGETDEKMFQVWLGVVLIFYTFLRESELLRLQIKAIDLQTGTIELPAESAKNNRDRLVTLPTFLVEILRGSSLMTYPTNYYLFAKSGLPGPKEIFRFDALYKRHQAFLKRLHKEGRLANIEGLSPYSYKDTGNTLFTKYLNPYELMNQNGHKDLKTTMIYYHSPTEANKNIQKLPNLVKGE